MASTIRVAVTQHWAGKTPAHSIGKWLERALGAARNRDRSSPVLSVPSDFGDNGVPTGIQIVAPSYRDAAVFQAAMAYEAATSGWFCSTADRPDF